MQRRSAAANSPDFVAHICAATLLYIVCFPATVSAAEVDPALRERLQVAIEDTGSFDDRFTATVWLTDMALRLNKRVPDPQERVQILQHVHQEAQRADLPPELVLAVIDIESAFDRFAISVAGARGLMQVMPFWLDELNQPEANLFDIQTNLRMGCTILRYYLDMEKGELSPALARYNGSIGKSWYSQRVLGRLSNRWFRQ
ncbi:MAG: transglycosylase SLT domain-containing protein [Gammaproteobacteria bacterium]|nr:transglycosylase SLT domain-containing protein [Gammaproteobacteria bacterium]MDP6695089.1 transglycosylase SLT domain-containing protein [Gammaproteobacteria bacterium]